ncbi:N1R/p28-like protein [Mudlarkpox virus]|nr:N1R/p28-like protein [Mudlarkpox virus]
MNNVILRHIDNQFCSVRLYDLCIIILKDGDYVNASKLCKYENKHFSDWKSLDTSKELIEYTETLLCDGLDSKFSAVINIKTDKKKVSGSYISMHLLPHLSLWLSPDIAAKISVMMKRYKELSIMYNNNTISYSDLCATIRNFNSQYDDNIIRIKNLYYKRVAAINLEFDEIKNKSKELRNKYYKEYNTCEMDNSKKEQYYREITSIKDKLVRTRKKLDDNAVNISFELVRIKQRYFSDLYKLNSYIISGKDFPSIIDKMNEMITRNETEDNDDVFV